MLICLVLVSSAADLIGVWSSSIKLLFNKLHPKSERVRRKMEGNLLKGTLVLEIRVLGVWLDGSVKGREALSALSMHERRAPMREKPSPRAWWSLNTKVPLPLLVGYFTMWSSHKGLCCGKCSTAIFDMYSSRYSSYNKFEELLPLSNLGTFIWSPSFTSTFFHFLSPFLSLIYCSNPYSVFFFFSWRQKQQKGTYMPNQINYVYFIMHASTHNITFSFDLIKSMCLQLVIFFFILFSLYFVSPFFSITLTIILDPYKNAMAWVREKVGGGITIKQNDGI